MAGSLLANVNFSLPLSSKTNTSTSNPFRLPTSLKPISRGYTCNTITLRPMAMAGENRDNLDHLQKANQQQPQAKKRVAQVTPIGLWDRFPSARTVQQMMDTMERVLEDPFAYSAYASQDNGAGYRRGRTPWEIKEGEEEFKMRFDMPGMTKKDVKIWVEEKMLIVKAEKVDENNQGEDGGEEEWSAKSYGKYSNRIALPENVELENIKAEVKDGVLYIWIPKAKASRKILDINVQ